ncbi:Trafficking protein particle complex II-specific subunit 130-like [Vitis vinifera]|uniref:Trafficking protein particle complex II-specific subunit 130-like n=1 Tax=Vitis vinifera TaxID=29760 RepID=A0A438DM16_VITVI|nr:Trafficking protein particle complex II-specific subunit 130-like [Vitis vinifera]
MIAYETLGVTLHSQVKATLTIYDAWLVLQDGFVHTGQGDGRPTSDFFPLVIAPTAKAGILFCICLGTTISGGIAPFSATNDHIFKC